MVRKRVALIARREALSLTQEEAAERAGVQTYTYQRWESGESKPSARCRRPLADAFEVSLAELNSLLQTAERRPHPVGSREAQSRPSKLTATNLQDVWSDGVSDRELRQLIRERLGDVESMPVYRTLSVSIDIKNPDGDAVIEYAYDMINCGRSPVFGETKSVWFENPSPHVSITASRCSRGSCSIQVRRDYANVKHFFCAFSEAIGPGQSMAYGYSYTVPGMFTQNHYWDQLVSQLTRTLEIRIRHRKGLPFLSAHVESESRSGLMVEPRPDLVVEESGGYLELRFRKSFPHVHAKYSLHWAFDESADATPGELVEAR